MVLGIDGPLPLFRSDSNYNDMSEINVSNDKAEKIITRYVSYLASEYGVPTPEVKVCDDDVWVQIVIDPDTVEANYDSIRHRINLNERDIKFEYVIHEFAHHRVHTDDDIDMVMEELISDGETEVDVIDGMNEMQTEALAKEMSKSEKIRMNWNQLVALGIGVNQVSVTNE